MLDHSFKACCQWGGRKLKYGANIVGSLPICSMPRSSNVSHPWNQNCGFTVYMLDSSIMGCEPPLGPKLWVHCLYKPNPPLLPWGPPLYQNQDNVVYLFLGRKLLGFSLRLHDYYFFYFLSLFNKMIILNSINKMTRTHTILKTTF